ncbi:tRNA 2-thiouridine synthesizing protein D [Rheinheimera pacifica]|uniref:tRNA 2-thiouridine synthesizing protein D n=1 Tax=Rheinheimera pacifica TaxID=173990 RepID=A0A1H6MET4_9GAMM|nr:sulfurtransferase complex subunit TusD [Rheinheimera pacifica]SEH97495.1 tRNA 2-thiouridine synthesizing protein D [Rheinheimera pacifica]
MTCFGLLLTSDSFASQSLASALLFAKTAVNHGHSIDHIFLYQDAVYSAANHIDLPADEPDLSAELAQFCQQQNIPLLFCVTAAEKRGVTGSNLSARPGYIAAGLAEFAMRQANIDKLVQF